MATLGIIGTLVALLLGLLWVMEALAVISIATRGVGSLCDEIKALKLEIQQVRYALIIGHDLHEIKQPDGSVALAK